MYFNDYFKFRVGKSRPWVDCVVVVCETDGLLVPSLRRSTVSSLSTASSLYLGPSEEDLRRGPVVCTRRCGTIVRRQWDRSRLFHRPFTPLFGIFPRSCLSPVRVGRVFARGAGTNWDSTTVSYTPSESSLPADFWLL